MSVKELRERTQAGFLDCKKALDESNGDMEKAVEILRAKGLAKASKRAGVDALDGAVVIKNINQVYGMLFFGTETDFVAKNDQFCQCADNELSSFIESDNSNITNIEIDGESFANRLGYLAAKIGENIVLKDYCKMISDDQGAVFSYVHNKLNDNFDNVARIGVLLKTKGATADVAKQLCMHIASFKPIALNEASMTSEQRALVGEERKLKDLVLDLQSYLMDPSQTVAAFCKNNNIQIVDFKVFSVK